MTGSGAEAFERCMSEGGVAVFPSDTVYGLACDPQNRWAVERLYAGKQRPLEKPSAVMFFDLELAVAALPELGPRTSGALQRLLPGGVTLLLPNPGRRFPLACGEDQGTLGLRVPVVPVLEGARRPVLQSSANLAGQPEARRLEDVPEVLRHRADLLIDGGELPGTASTVVDLRQYEGDGSWRVTRAGAVGADELSAALEGELHFDPTGYASMIREDIQSYDHLQEELAAASGEDRRRVLELGTGTGETALRLLERHPRAALVGLDEDPSMLDLARSRLPAERVHLQVARLQQALPEGPFDLVASALCVHHLTGAEKQGLFARIRTVLGPGGRFVLADVVVPERPEDAVIPVSVRYDRPSRVDEQLRWLDEAGFEAEVTWRDRDLAVFRADG